VEGRKTANQLELVLSLSKVAYAGDCIHFFSFIFEGKIWFLFYFYFPFFLFALLALWVQCIEEFLLHFDSPTTDDLVFTGIRYGLFKGMHLFRPRVLDCEYLG
jgi:hypothetical protein